jgi:hypothetical protein
MLELVPGEILAPPSSRERRRLDRDLCAELLDGLLRRLARQEALCRRVLGRLAAILLHRQGHQRIGFARLDDYARERLGLSGRELQDLARVMQRLPDLPAIAAAFADGLLSWSHVRLLVAVASAEDEGTWLARARHTTVRELQAAITTERRAVIEPDDDTVEGEARSRFHLRCPRRVRRLWRNATELASRMSGTRLSAWRAAEAIAAEALAGPAEIQEAAPAGPRSGSASTALPTACWEAIHEALPDDIAALENFPYADPFRVDAALRTTVAALQRIDFQTGRLLRLVAELGLHRAFGFRTLPDYVRERLGFSLRKARALIALDRRLPELPALAAAYREGRLSFARAMVLLPAIHPSTEAAWLARAQEVTLRRLGDLVDWAVEVAEPDHPLPPPPAEATLVLPEEMQMCARGCDAEVRFDGPASVVALLWTAVRTYTPRGAASWQGFERLLRHALAEWRARPRHRDPIFERDGWRCAVPACTARTSLHDHHVLTARGAVTTRVTIGSPSARRTI